MESLAARLDRGVARVLEQAKTGQRPLGMTVSLPGVDLLEAVIRYPFDWFLINQEHTMISDSRLLSEMMRVIERTPAPAFVKINTADPMLARDAMDAGAAGVQVPFVESGDQLRSFLEGFRFPPAGKRGFCIIARVMEYTPERGVEDYIQFVNERALVIPQIESRDGVERIDEIIAAAEGCPVVAIGPTDLFHSLCLDARSEEDFRYLTRVIATICKKVHAAGKLIMCPTIGPTYQSSRDVDVERIETLGLDLPYAGEVDCLFYGMKEALRIREDAQKRSAETRARTR